MLLHNFNSFLFTTKIDFITPKYKNQLFLNLVNIKQRYCYNYLTQRGNLPPDAAVAILGCVIAETGGTFDPHVQQEGSKIGNGLCQWEDERGSDRFNDMVAYLKPQGKDPYSLDGQLEFIIYELNTTHTYLHDILFSTSTVNWKEKAKDFFLYYEGASVDYSDPLTKDKYQYDTKNPFKAEILDILLHLAPSEYIYPTIRIIQSGETIDYIADDYYSDLITKYGRDVVVNAMLTMHNQQADNGDNNLKHIDPSGFLIAGEDMFMLPEKVMEQYIKTGSIPEEYIPAQQDPQDQPESKVPVPINHVYCVQPGQSLNQILMAHHISLGDIDAFIQINNQMSRGGLYQYIDPVSSALQAGLNIYIPSEEELNMYKIQYMH